MKTIPLVIPMFETAINLFTFFRNNTAMNSYTPYEGDLSIQTCPPYDD